MLKLLSAQDMQALDRATMEKEPISSLALMERAATRWYRAALPWLYQHSSWVIVAGKGNNGGDGLVIARLMREAGFDVCVLHCAKDTNFSTDSQVNLENLLKGDGLEYHHVKSVDQLTAFNFTEAGWIDALFGTGLSRPIEGFYAEVVHWLNQQNGEILAVDIPSGMFCDGGNNQTDPIVKATHTITFQLPKRALLLPENAEYCPSWEPISIGLHQPSLQNLDALGYWFTNESARKLLKRRSIFAHKGTYGHLAVVAGNTGTIGAAILASCAALKTGAGLVSTFSTADTLQPLMAQQPEIMCHTSKLSELQPDLSSFSTCAVGPGIGTAAFGKQQLDYVLAHASTPVVLDADALNILAEMREWLDSLPANSILTPHPKELARLIGKTQNSLDQLAKAQAFADEYQVVVLIKRAHTVTVIPQEIPIFNSSGNPGMATAGSGDVLTGIIGALLAQGFEPKNAAALGVYVHGLAGDMASHHYGQMGMVASDIIAELPFALKQLNGI